MERAVIILAKYQRVYERFIIASKLPVLSGNIRDIFLFLCLQTMITMNDISTELKQLRKIMLIYGNKSQVSPASHELYGVPFSLYFSYRR